MIPLSIYVVSHPWIPPTVDCIVLKKLLMEKNPCISGPM